jgi:hypothetical protein
MNLFRLPSLVKFAILSDQNLDAFYAIRSSRCLSQNIFLDGGTGRCSIRVSTQSV